MLVARATLAFFHVPFCLIRFVPPVKISRSVICIPVGTALASTKALALPVVTFKAIFCSVTKPAVDENNNAPLWVMTSPWTLVTGNLTTPDVLNVAPRTALIPTPAASVPSTSPLLRVRSVPLLFLAARPLRIQAFPQVPGFQEPIWLSLGLALTNTLTRTASRVFTRSLPRVVTLIAQEVIRSPSCRRPCGTRAGRAPPVRAGHMRTCWW